MVPFPMTPDAQDLCQVFRQVTATSCPRVYNFHLHTDRSDGQLSPQALVDQALEIGLRGFAITDHHSTEGYGVAQAYLHQRQAADPDRHRPWPRLWSGVEITAQLLDVDVHVLAYGFVPDHPAIVPYIPGFLGYSLQPMPQAAAVIPAIQAAGGVAVLAHPCRYRKPAPDLIAEAVNLGIDGVETYYAYGNPSPWQASDRQTRLVQSLGERYQLLHTCGTDSHGPSLLTRL